MLFAVHAGGGTMAQFSIPELGGSGQWMRGGMTMVGNMFDNALKARVDALCGELAQLLATATVFPASTTNSQVGFTSANWWPADLGVPSASGKQNDARYAIFPSTRRLAIQINGVTRSIRYRRSPIGGVQQQQGGGYGSVGFTSQFGTFGISSLSELGTRAVGRNSSRCTLHAVSVPNFSCCTRPAAGGRDPSSRTRRAAPGRPGTACRTSDADTRARVRRVRGSRGHRRGHRVAGRTA